MTPRRLLPLAALLATAALTACGASSEGALDTQANTPAPTCLVHQTKNPAQRYTPGTGADTLAVLDLMRYYTANGTKPYCDGRPPTTTDKRWTQLYTSLGGAPAHLALPSPS
ncbi:hypothetical protein C7C46_27635 [Streptomyces tateyamensis]|uniref:Lipoprotein n=1 Tax=Streptomyces tateyamensis TaxID=565073 RepID=A0A2V4N268_9ACTN|nr:hypothetical protein [Streptomyces tateyamensis]PYC70179.1 hypothetical protein C7C46_27635 [Streptomyces tateyamensis]